MKYLLLIAIMKVESVGKRYSTYLLITFSNYCIGFIL